MPRDEELVGSYISRKESPEIEMIVQENIGDALFELMTSKGLYQKSELSFKSATDFLASVGNNDADRFKKEFSKRPWVPLTMGLPKENHMRSELFCGIDDVPLNTPDDEMKLTFPLPSIKTYCNKCKENHTFSSIGVLWADRFMNYYPKICEKTQQIFNLSYNCTMCSNNVICFLIKREGLKLHLCGRSERVHIETPKVIPKKLRNIVTDAIGATSENDVYAGFYHLRTFCEHYMKQCLDFPASERITGDELSDRYNSSIDNRMASGLPSMSVIYETTSKHMHERTGTRDDFYALLSDIEGHLSAKKLFTKYGTN